MDHDFFKRCALERGLALNRDDIPRGIGYTREYSAIFGHESIVNENDRVGKFFLSIINVASRYDKKKRRT